MNFDNIEFSCPDELRNVPLEMGIDETGRGPVLGPMIYCAAFAPLNYSWPESVDDSKKLTQEKRNSILEELKKCPIGFITRSIPASEISSVILSHSGNLNTISFETVYHIIQKALDEGLDIKKLYVDTVGNEEAYKERLEKRFHRMQITVSAKGDSKYKCVGAASINAKVRRDKEIEEFQFQGDDSEVYSTIVPFNKLVDILREDLEGIFEMME